MFVVDMEQGRIIPDEELKADICSRQPYQEWLDEHKIKTSNLTCPIQTIYQIRRKVLLKRQMTMVIRLRTSYDIGSNGRHQVRKLLVRWELISPLAVLSDQSQHISYYFKQLFAQVTNPPIDSIRERSIMSLISFVGAADNILNGISNALPSVAVGATRFDY